MKLEMKKILPKDPSSFNGFKTIRILTALYLLVAVVRSCIHLFAEDGGAESIAGVDTSVAGGDNIIAIFHQWGAIQLILALLLSLLFFRYPGFTPLILITLAVDPILRWIAGRMLPLTTVGTPPGESLNWVAFVSLAVLFAISLISKKHKS
jgi:hypothetical protein